MRELKFRVWNNRYNEFVRPDYGLIGFCYPLDGSISVLTTSGNPMEDCIIEQYTGLKDKNGKEIYEGDILREKGLLSLTYLEWDKNHARYQTKVIDKSKHVSSIFDFDIIDALECEVVGNIHDNPELIGEEE